MGVGGEKNSGFSAEYHAERSFVTGRAGKLRRCGISPSMPLGGARNTTDLYSTAGGWRGRQFPGCEGRWQGDVTKRIAIPGGPCRLCLCIDVGIPPRATPGPPFERGSALRELLVGPPPLCSAEGKERKCRLAFRRVTAIFSLATSH